MARSLQNATLAAAFLAAFATRPARGEGPALAVELRHPDRQLARLLGLFEGTPTPSPAAALAAWKLAAPPGSPRSLGKGAEAAIAALNPEMVRELAALEGASFHLAIDDAGHWRWSLAAPHDDGTLRAAVVAIALTDGGPEPPIAGRPVDRLGPPGSALAATGRRGLAIGDRPESLATALARLDAPPASSPDAQPGWSARLDAVELARSESIEARRIAAGLAALGLAGADLTLRPVGVDTIELVATGLHRAKAPPRPAANSALDPGWLDLVPADHAAASIAVALGPDRDALALLFAAADAVERADPAHADVAPLRTRLNVLALGVGLRPEAELWPRLRGVTAWVARGDDGGVLALHATDPESADALARRIVPQLVGVLSRSRPAGRPAVVDGGPPLPIGQFRGRLVEVARRGSTVVVGWGASRASQALAGLDDPARSAGDRLRAGWPADRPPSACLAAWPDRLVTDPAVADAIRGVPPVVGWTGADPAGMPITALSWSGLRPSVRRALDRLDLGPEGRR